MTANPHETFVIPEFNLADRMRKAREHSGLDQAEFAEELGISRGTVSNAERGLRHPRKIVLKAWALATGVPLSWIESGTVKQETPPLSSDGESLGVRAKGLEPPTS